MKTITTLIFLFLISMAYEANAQSPSWLWGRTTVGGNNSNGPAIATDPYGNVYMTGSTQDSTITFGSYTITNPVYGRWASNHNAIFFLAKYSGTGQLIWARGAGIANPAGISIATDEQGNVFVAGGLYKDTVNFTGSMAYLTKYDSAGHELWTASPGNTGTPASSCTGVATDADGNAYISGYGPSNINFGSVSLTGSQFASNFFLVKYAPSGQPLWGRNANTFAASVANARAVTTDPSGNVIVMGNFGGDSLGIGNIVLHPRDHGSSFIAKYDSIGQAIWARCDIGEESFGFADVATDRAGNVFLTGFTIDTFTLGPFMVLNSGVHTFYIAMLNASGIPIWVRSGGNTGAQDMGFSLVTDAGGSVSVSGVFQHSFTVGTVTLNPPSGLYPIDSMNHSFIITFSGKGDVVCSEALPFASLNDLAIDPSGYIFWAGHDYDSVFVLGNGVRMVSASSGENLFVSKFSPCGGVHDGIGTVSENASLSLYPNPFSSSATVKYDLMENGANATLTISDMLGQVRNSYPLTQPQGEVNINAGGLSSGVYLYSLTAGGKTIATKKMVVE